MNKLQELIKSKGFTPYINEDVLKTAPKQIKGKIEFFKLDRYISNEDLEKEYESRGLVPADPYSMLSIDLSILDEKRYVATHWKDKDGKWCFASFRRWSDDGRYVNVDQYAYDWLDYWWFGGVRKSSDSVTKPSSETLSLDEAIKLVKKSG
jgi:hypothetical protein